MPVGEPQQDNPAAQIVAACGGVFDDFSWGRLFVFYGGNLFDKIVWVLLAAAGLAVAFYEDALLPFLVRRQAESQYEQRKGELTAQSVRLYQNA